MKLIEVIKAVKEKNLPKDKLEEYRDDLSNLAAEMQFEMADLKKEEAIYFMEHRQDTDVATKRAWRITKSGQRLIELSHYYKATEKILSSLKSRLYDRY